MMMMTMTMIKNDFGIYGDDYYDDDRSLIMLDSVQIE